jgi:carotenoid cleavage dioxygenase-like enzyme
MNDKPAAGAGYPGLQFPPAAEGGPVMGFRNSKFGQGGSVGGNVHRSENTLIDCEVEGTIPKDLNGVFYRVGPDPQYPKPKEWENDIAFDGEGHASMFHIKDGHVDYRSRYVKTQRWKAQNKARRSLFGMYRNPLTDDPSVKGLSRGTANTHVFFHHGKLFALKEDSPPVALNPLTLETTDDYYTFGGGLESETFTAHPKIDSETGEFLCFGYEAKGLLSTDINVFSVDTSGKINWSAWIKAPYSCMIHDFGITDKHIAFLAIPMVGDMDLLKRGGPHWIWDSSLPSYLGVMRRGGDGKDIQWIKGPAWMATHTMGNWSDGDTLYFDMDGAPGNQFAFFPHKHEEFDPQNAAGRVVRMTVDTSKKAPETYEMETLFPEYAGVLSRQDDRYHTVKYRYGFLMTFGPKGTSWTMMDHQKGVAKSFSPGPETGLSEMCFVPRRKGAPEGDGYLIGVGTRVRENGRSDVFIVDTQDVEAGPIATIKMPYRVPAQVHGFWVSGDELPSA